MTAREFTEWQAYYSLEPFGERRADYRTAQIVQMLANINRGPDTKPFPLSDFLPDEIAPEPEEEETEGEEPWRKQIEMAALWTGALGGEDLRR
jgi:hypothetical protein